MNELIQRLEALTSEHRELIKELSREKRRLEALTLKQREPIKELVHENRQLKLKTKILSNRLKNLEKTYVVIDREIAEIPIGFELIPEGDLNRY